MDASASSWVVIVLAIIGANLPFSSERLFAILPLRRGESAREKSFWWRLAEMFVLYLVVGGVGMLLEANIGNVFSQTWGFYAVTGCLFVVLAFPGFAFRYLRKQHR